MKTPAPKTAPKGQTRRFLLIALGIVGISATIAMSGFLWRLNATTPDLTSGWMIAGMAGVLILLVALWIVFGVLDTHFDGLERLRTAILVAASRTTATLPPLPAETLDEDAGRLWHAVNALRQQRATAMQTAQDRLTDILATLEEGIIVLTQEGQVSLINNPAKQMLGPDRVKVGTSIFSALERDPLVKAMDEALEMENGNTINCTLEDVDGGMYAASVTELTHHSGIVVRIDNDHPQKASLSQGTLDHDLSLHDHLLPDLNALDVHDRPTDDTPLEDLAALVFDSETTGLDVRRDRMISMGGIRLKGTHTFHALNIDCLINPGIPIPPASTDVHGINDAMVADALDFFNAWPELERIMRGAVIIGHSISFDLTILAAEAGRADIPFHPPPALDTLLLAHRLFPQMENLNLENLAAELGVDVRGRHTALGDALVTSEIYLRLLPLLADAGVHTLGEARAFSTGAKSLLNRQRALGWQDHT